MKGKVALRPGLGQLLPHKRVAACERSTVGLIGQWVRSTGGRAGDLHTTSGSKCTGNTQVATLQSGVFITGAVRCGAVPDRARPRVRPCSPSILQVVLVLARWIGGDWWCVVWCLLCCEGPPGPRPTVAPPSCASSPLRSGSTTAGPPSVASSSTAAAPPCRAGAHRHVCAGCVHSACVMV